MSAARARAGPIIFFLIAFGVPWAGWIWLRQTMPLDQMFGSFALVWFTAAPSVAGFVAAAVEGDLGGFARRVLNVRFAWWLWLLAPALPLLAALLTFAAHPADLLHGGAPHWAKLAGTFTLMNLFTGPLAEEFGWRGYLLGRLKPRPWLAGLVIAPIWIAWHLPIFYDSLFAHLMPAIGYAIWVAGLSVILSLLVTRARGAVWVAILGHFAANIAPGVFFKLFPALPGEAQPGGMAFSIAMAAVAAGLAILWRGRDVAASR